MELRIEGKEGTGVVRAIRFSNGETLFELEGDGHKKQYLEVLPSRLTLYSGLAADEGPQTGAKNPFIFLDMAFAHPLRALNMAHGAGPASVQEGPKQTSLVLEPGQAATITTSRISKERVRFRLVSAQNKFPAMEGSWDAQLREPLPDELSLKTWKYDLPEPLATLRDARSASRKPEQGGFKH